MVGPQGRYHHHPLVRLQARRDLGPTIQGPGGGSAFPNHVVWKEIVKPERIVWLYGNAKDDPNAVETTATLADRGGSTEVTLRLVFGSKEQREQAAKYGAEGGARQTLERLAAAVTSH